MPDSPTTNLTASTKRPLEDPSSPSGPTDLPDAKRPALGKTNENGQPEGTEGAPDVNGQLKPDSNVKVDSEQSPAVVSSTKDSQGDTAVPDAPSVAASGPQMGGQSIHSTVAGGDRASTGSGQPQHQDESSWIHIRAVISSAEAATVIGKGGENVTAIRKIAGAKCTVSEYSRGAVERILTVSGLVDAVAKAFGLILRTLNNEPLEAPSTPQSKTYPLRLLIPHILIGSIIGKQGVRIREIQEASGARLNASDSCLPLSTERSLVIMGVADAVHIAVYYVATTLVEQLTDRFGGPAASAYATRTGGPAGAVPGGMQVVPYVPQAISGTFGHPDSFRRGGSGGHAQRPTGSQYGMQHGYGQGPPHHQQQPGSGAMPYAGSPQGGYGGHQLGGMGGHPHQPPMGGPHAGHAGPPAQPMPGIMPGQPLTQQIFIPNDMVGAIIGKGGAKINEIRQLSGSVIKINEPQDNSNERLVTITGTSDANQMALYMLYSRLESEKHRI
ncbi:MAG: hypothetical protein M1823_000371 [Watsoniomyces obsoletus]|nr:MAG: hypothetical protein M1823_000371 [Watsoniomyces obsoletus]